MISEIPIHTLCESRDKEKYTIFELRNERTSFFPLKKSQEKSKFHLGGREEYGRLDATWGVVKAQTLYNCNTACIKQHLQWSIHLH